MEDEPSVGKPGDRTGERPDAPDDVEGRLQVALTAASAAVDAAQGSPVADSDDLSRRIRTRAARRNRVAAVAAVALLVAAAGGGYIAGTAGEDGADAPRVVAADRFDRTATDGAETGAADEQSGAGASGRGPTESTIVNGSGVAADKAVASFAPGLGPAAALFQRTMPDGTVLDVRTYDYYADGAVDLDGDPSWDPPRWCFPTGSYYVGVRAQDAVGQASGERYEEVKPGSLVVSPSVIGVPEGAPRWVVIVQAPSGVAKVRATFPGGGSDEFAPVSGTAVLSARTDSSMGQDPTSGEAREGELVIEGVDAGGAVVARWSGNRWGSPDGSGEPSLDTGSDDVVTDEVPSPQTTFPQVEPQPAEVPPGAIEPAPAEPGVGSSPGSTGSGGTGSGSECWPAGTPEPGSEVAGRPAD